MKYLDENADIMDSVMGGCDLGLLCQAGHRFFFSPEELESLRMEAI